MAPDCAVSNTARAAPRRPIDCPDAEARACCSRISSRNCRIDVVAPSARAAVTPSHSGSARTFASPADATLIASRPAATGINTGASQVAPKDERQFWFELSTEVA